MGNKSRTATFWKDVDKDDSFNIDDKIFVNRVMVAYSDNKLSYERTARSLGLDVTVVYDIVKSEKKRLNRRYAAIEASHTRDLKNRIKRRARNWEELHARLTASE